MINKAWKTLYKNTRSLQKAANIKNILSKAEVEDLHINIKDILIQFLKEGETHLGLKTYVNKELQQMGEKMKASPLLDSDTWETWANTIFGDEKFGMILNSLESYSNLFAEKMATIIKPLLNESGIPLGGISFLFFMGNYGFTPFGVHKEATGEEGILFHLGPGKKQFYTWDNPKLNVIKHNTEVFHDFDKMMKNAVCYDLQAGDAMFIPHQVFHIANSSEFSLSIVMDYINPPENVLLQELFEISKEDDFSNNQYSKPVKINAPLEAHLLEKEFITKKIDRAYKFKVLLLKSNGGFSKPSILNYRNRLPANDFSIVGKASFPTQIDSTNTNMFSIFARGHHFKSRKNNGLYSIIEKLNCAQTISFSNAKDLLLNDWELSEVFSFFSNLYIQEAIEIKIIG